MLYEHTSSEGHDTGPKVTRVEGHIDSWERNGSKSTLQLDVAFGFLEFLCFMEGVINDLPEHFFDLVHGESFCELREHC